MHFAQHRQKNFAPEDPEDGLHIRGQRIQNAYPRRSPLRLDKLKLPEDGYGLGLQVRPILSICCDIGYTAPPGYRLLLVSDESNKGNNFGILKLQFVCT